jgi:hypothetical protein
MNKIIEYNGALWLAKKENKLEFDTIMIMLVKFNEYVYTIIQVII